MLKTKKRVNKLNLLPLWKKIRNSSVNNNSIIRPIDDAKVLSKEKQDKRQPWENTNKQTTPQVWK